MHTSQKVLRKKKQTLFLPVQETAILAMEPILPTIIRYNTNYCDLISKYVGGGAEGGPARTAVSVLGGQEKRARGWRWWRRCWR